MVTCEEYTPPMTEDNVPLELRNPASVFGASSRISLQAARIPRARHEQGRRFSNKANTFDVGRVPYDNATPHVRVLVVSVRRRPPRYVLDGSRADDMRANWFAWDASSRSHMLGLSIRHETTTVAAAAECNGEVEERKAINRLARTNQKKR